MFNRRHLRIKAMQALFNYSQKQRVGLQLGLDHLEEYYAPDLNSMEAPNLPVLKKNKKIATQFFNAQFQKETLDIEASEDVKKGVISAKTLYNKYLLNERKLIVENTENDLDNVWHNYISIVKFLEDLCNHITFVFENNENKRTKAILNKVDFKLGETEVFKKVNEVDEYVSYINKKKFLWEDDDSIIKNFYRETLLKDDKYKEYLEQESSLENDAALLTYICRKMLWKNGQISDFFEEQDVFWGVNKDIVTGLLTKSFKKLKNEGEFELIQLSPNWEDDKDYLFLLLDEGFDFSPELKERVQKKLENWDLERLAIVDKIILELAIIEMIECPSIPVKVTINEFLELTKKYSHPKSKQFINGVLDGISKELINEKVIRKSGRGLMDNK